MRRGKINKIIKFSNVDGPGNRVSIFFQECNYNCLYCHNPETINRCSNCGECIAVCPVGALNLEGSKVLWDGKICVDCGKCEEICELDSTPKTIDYSVEELLEEIKKVKGFIRGITVSGGEATLNYEFITELFIEVKKIGLTTFVDTNGSIDMSDDIYSEFLQVTDKFMVDMKCWNEKNHSYLTGNKNHVIRKNIEILGRLGKLYEVRTVIIPGLLDNIETVDEVSRLIAKINSENLNYESIIYKLIKYRSLGVRKDILNKNLNGIKTPTESFMEQLYTIAKENGVKKVIKTI